MSHEGNYGPFFYHDQEYQNYHGMPSDAYGNAGHQHMLHRDSDTIDLSQFHQNANAANELPMQHLTKPVNDTAWNPQLRGLPQVPQFHRPTWNGSGMSKSGAATEPITNQEVLRFSPHKSSEFSDSAYESMATSGGALETSFNTNGDEVMGDYFARALKSGQVEPPVKVKPPQSVKSEGRFLAPPNNNNRRKQPVAPCPFPGCNKQPKNASDAKKHELTHTKPHKCHEPECNRSAGFATINDLERHKKSVHSMTPRVGNPAGYICAACPFVEGGRPKFWPRRDNFKAHIRRKHTTHHEEQLLEASKQNIRPDDAQTADGRSVCDAAFQSARQSQVDPNEGHVFQHTSPFLTQATPDQHDGTVFPPDSAIESHGDPIAFTGGHMDDQMLFGDQEYPMPSPTQLDANSFPFPSSGQRHPDPIQRDFARPQQPPRHQMLPSIQVTASSFSEPQSASTASTSQSAGGASATQGSFPCKICQKVKSRECDLRKHMKRHTRPYGCTFPSCTKKFGSRNDWKRHESSQHYLTEMWKCGLHECTHRPFTHLSQMEEHLRSDHGIHSQPHIAKICDEGKLGREGHHRFWCGFCKHLIKQESQGVQGGNAWDARFKHIGDHFDKDQRDSGEWFCIEENRPKYLLSGHGNGMKRGKTEEEEGLPEGVIEGVNDGSSWVTSKKRKLESPGGDEDAQGESDHEMYR